MNDKESLLGGQKCNYPSLELGVERALEGIWDKERAVLGPFPLFPMQRENGQNFVFSMFFILRIF